MITNLDKNGITVFSWVKLLDTGIKICVVCNQSVEGGTAHLARHEKKNRHKKMLKSYEYRKYR